MIWKWLYFVPMGLDIFVISFLIQSAVRWMNEKGIKTTHGTQAEFLSSLFRLILFTLCPVLNLIGIVWLWNLQEMDSQIKKILAEKYEKSIDNEEEV